MRQYKASGGFTSCSPWGTLQAKSPSPSAYPLMKKLLFQFDTDIHPSVFDSVVAYDGGADHVIGHGGLTPELVGPLVDGTIFTRPPKEKKNTAIFVGGSDMEAGEALLSAVRKRFFGDFRVSVMLDSNGSNTTAAACVAKLMSSGSISGKRAVVLAGTGPVGQRAALMLAKAGASEIVLTSRQQARANKTAADLQDRFGIKVIPLEAPSAEDRARTLEGAHILLATGATGVELLKEAHWISNPTLELVADANAAPPLGLGGLDMMDRGTDRSGKKVWGAIGFGTLKLALHRACIAKLFETNTQVLNAEAIFDIAKEMA